jgi:hypothetical protein
MGGGSLGNAVVVGEDAGPVGGLGGGYRPHPLPLPLRGGERLRVGTRRGQAPPCLEGAEGSGTSAPLN